MKAILHRPSTLARTVCKHGHAWIPENLRTNHRGVLQCRLCVAACVKRRQAENKAAHAAITLAATQIN